MTAINSETLAEFVAEIVEPDPKWLKQARTHLDNLTKPPGSLGRLEDIAAHCIQTLREVQPGGPYFLSGWSDAGVIAGIGGF